MKYAELKEIFRAHERTCPKEHLTAHITFTADSFDTDYSIEARTYIVSSDNKAYRPNMAGYSIWGDSLDGSDTGVRLERYMAEEHGGDSGWKVENCEIICS